MSLKISVSGLLLVCSFNLSAQEDKTQAGRGAPAAKVAQNSTKVNVIYRSVEQKAEPKFNTSEYFRKNIKYPELALENKVQGRVAVQFVVEKDGSLSDIKVIRGQELGNGIPEEAIRIISNMPKWKPAIADGKAVRSYYIIPVSFNL